MTIRIIKDFRCLWGCDTELPCFTFGANQAIGNSLHRFSLATQDDHFETAISVRMNVQCGTMACRR
jgi:hypothetical protein